MSEEQKPSKVGLSKKMFAVLIVGLLSASFVLSVGAYYVSKNYLFPEPSFKEQLLSSLPDALKNILSDAKYDEDYFLAQQAGVNLENLTLYFKPVVVRYFIKTDQGIGSVDIIGIGMLVGEYVLTSFTIFSPLYDPEVQAAIKDGVISYGVKLVADVQRDDPFKSENLELVYLGDWTAILKRKEPFAFPVSTEMPFRKGRLTDLNPDSRPSAFYGFGNFISDDPSGLLLYTYQGQINTVSSLAREKFILFSAPLFFDESQGQMYIRYVSSYGGPIFVLRDGEPELAGLVGVGGQGVGIAVPIETLLKEALRASQEYNIAFTISFLN